MVGSKALAAVLGLFTLIITERALDDPVLFGTVVFIHAYMLFFSEVGAFQPWQAIIRYGSRDIEDGDADGFARLLKFGIKLDFVSAVVSTLLAIGLFQLFMWLSQFLPLPGRGQGMDPGELQVLTSAYCLLILFRQRGTSIGIFRIFDKFSVLAVKALIMPVLRFAGAVLAAQMGWGIVGFLCVWFFASLAGYIYLPTMGALELKRRGLLGNVFKSKVSFLRPREGLWDFAIKTNIDSTLAAAHLQLPMLLVTAVFGQAVGGVYKIAEEVAKLLSEGFRLLDQVIYPEFARMVTEERADEIWALVRKAALAMLGVGGLLSALVILAGPGPFNAIFKQDFTLASPIAALLVPAAALMGVVAPLYPVMYAAGKPERALYARGAGIAVYIVSFFALAQVVGPTAPGWAMLVGNGFAVILAIHYARKTLREETGKVFR